MKFFTDVIVRKYHQRSRKSSEGCRHEVAVSIEVLVAENVRQVCRCEAEALDDSESKLLSPAKLNVT